MHSNPTLRSKDKQAVLEAAHHGTVTLICGSQDADHNNTLALPDIPATLAASGP